MANKKILILSDSPVLSSGLARVGRELATRFHKDHYEVAYLGWQHTNMPHKLPFYIYPIIRGSKNEPAWVLTAIKNFKPDILLCIGDIWYFDYLEEILKEYKEGIPERWLYLTLDAEPFYPDWGKILDCFTRIYTQSKFARNQILRVFPNKEIKAVWLGVDKHIFKPLKQRNLWTDKFVVMVNAFNCGRKNLPLSIEAFAEFAKDKQDTLLFMLTQANHGEGHNLGRLVYWYGIQDKVFFEKTKTATRGIPDESVNYYYNNADCLLSTTSGEGFGLFILEAFSTKLPVIATAYSSIPELLADGRGIQVPVSAYIHGTYEIKRAIVSKEETIKGLDLMYANYKVKNKEIAKMTEKAYNFAKHLTWDKTYHEILGWLDKKGDWAKW